MPQPIPVPASFPLKDFAVELTSTNTIALFDNNNGNTLVHEYDLQTQGPVNLRTLNGNILFSQPIGAPNAINVDLDTPETEAAFFKIDFTSNPMLIGADDLSYELVVPSPHQKEVHRFMLSQCPVDIQATNNGTRCIAIKFAGNGGPIPGYTKLIRIRR